jgi:hypothetical protein
LRLIADNRGYAGIRLVIIGIADAQTVNIGDQVAVADAGHRPWSISNDRHVFEAEPPETPRRARPPARSRVRGVRRWRQS